MFMCFYLLIYNRVLYKVKKIFWVQFDGNCPNGVLMGEEVDSITKK
jgi:hypothetical protein